VKPADALCGKTVVGLYFGCPSCGHCVQLLKDLRHLASSRTNTAIILVSHGTTALESKQYFGDMYDWLMVPHEAATGSVGSALADRFQVRTILALVLLDAAGKVICTDGRGRLTADRLGRDFPWQDPARIQKPTVNFDLPGQARPLDLPPLQLRPQLAPQGGPPPAFTCHLPDLARPPSAKATSVTPLANIDLSADVHQQTRRRRDVARNPSETTQQLPQLAVSTPVSVPEARPPPKPNRGTTLGLGVKTYSPATDSACGNGRQKPKDIPQATVETSNGAHLAEVQCLRDAAWKVIGSAMMDGPAWARYWKAWLEHCRLYPDNHRRNGLPPANIDDMFLTFAVAMWEGKFGLGHQVKVQSVAVALRSVAQKYILDGHPNPR
jgi:hypothetical protein